MTPTDEPQMRIGALARLVGVNVGTLRAWERRYGVPEPARTESGFRLYSAADEAQVRTMLGYMATGLAPAQAAQRARGGVLHESAGPVEPIDTGLLQRPREALLAACLAFDARAAHAAIDEVIAAFTVSTVVDDVLFWCIREVGKRQEAGLSISEEHFTSALIRERMLALARGWDAGTGRRVLLACPPNERHDIGLISLGLALHRHGWRVTFLGADMPVGSVARAYAVLRPKAVVLSAQVPERFGSILDELQPLSSRTRLFLAGPGAAHVVAQVLGAERLVGDPVTAAATLTAYFPFSPEGTAKAGGSTA